MIVIEKLVGQTPLAAITKWKAEHPEFRDIPATYAGRLDPMASGTLLILLGDECKKRGKYTKYDKEYVIEVVLGISTDTGDALGLPKVVRAESNPTRAEIHAALSHLSGSHTIPYPAFSSKTVKGKPLFQYALEGTLDTVTVPEHTETIYQLQLLKEERIGADALRARINDTLRLVPRSDEPSKALGADFRQDRVRAAWSSLFADVPAERTFPVFTLRVTCASGTYMRTLAARLGTALGTLGFALSIHRTKIGRYVPLGRFGFWLSQHSLRG